jgi:hypothetical protein
MNPMWKLIVFFVIPMLALYVGLLVRSTKKTASE